jgi:2-iminobutanoate/2-iminopropanoate deaminase
MPHALCVKRKELRMNFISADNAPAAIGPYSQAVDTGEFVFLSGQLPLDPSTMRLTGETIAEQAERVFDNITAVLKAAELTLSHIVKTTVFLADINDFAAMNAVYEKRFGAHKPARSAIQAAALPRGSLIEIECIAARERA